MGNMAGGDTTNKLKKKKKRKVRKEESGWHGYVHIVVIT
jgi:hypothetical protein